MTSPASIALFLQTHSQVPPRTLADYSSQIPTFRSPQIHQTAQREQQQCFHSKSTSPGSLIYVNPILPPPPAWAALSTRGAQEGRREPAGAWKSLSPSSSSFQHLTPPTAASAQIPKEPFHFFCFPPQVEKHPRGKWESQLPSTFGKTNSRALGEGSLPHPGNPLDPLLPLRIPDPPR